MKDDPIPMLAVLYDELSIPGHISSDSYEWLYYAIEALATGESETLDEALGIGSSDGIAKSGTRFRKHLRDRLLHSLLLHDINQGKSKWAASTKLSEDIHRFKSRVYPIINRNKKRLDSASYREKVLLKVMQVDEDPPRSASTLYNLLK